MLCLRSSRFRSLRKLFVPGISLAPRHPLSFLNTFVNTRSLTTSTFNTIPPHPTLNASLMIDPEGDLFNYTSGRFLANEAYRLRQRRSVFNIPGLFNVIAKAINCSPNQIVGFQKLQDGALNRVFLITLDNNFQMIARIPYPRTVSKAYAIASEIATMRFLRSKGIPIPEVYGYSFTSDNEAETEYILMEYVDGTDLSQIWYDLKEEEIMTLMEQVVQIEEDMMSIEFPAGGSIYYARDLMEISGMEGIPFEDESDVSKNGFRMGPDVSPSLWHGQREKMDVFRGPYTDGKSVMLTGAKKELEYLKRFGTPTAPQNRIRRVAYNFQKQPPSDHVRNLAHYLRVAPWLVPNDYSLNTFCIRHPQLSEDNIKVSKESGSLEIVSILDWQYAAVLPLFLNAYLPAFIPVEEDEITRSLEVHPTSRLPENFDELPEEEKYTEEQLYRRRLVHYHYALRTATHNQFHHHGLTYPLSSFTRRIHHYATQPWRGETIGLLCALIDFERDWSWIISESGHSYAHPISIHTTNVGKFNNVNTLGTLLELVRFWDYVSANEIPCPITSTKDEVDASIELSQMLSEVDKIWEILKQSVGCGDDTWVSADYYEVARLISEDSKGFAGGNPDNEDSDVIAVDKISNSIVENWPFDDMSEEELEDFY